MSYLNFFLNLIEKLLYSGYVDSDSDSDSIYPESNSDLESPLQTDSESEPEQEPALHTENEINTINNVYPVGMHNRTSHNAYDNV